MTSSADREIDFTSPAVQAAYDNALTGWGQMLDPKGRTPGDAQVATILEESLKERFGVTDDEAWVISSKALRDIRELRKNL